MLEEAVDVIRLLWQGGMQSHHGRHYTVENARIHTLPDPPPEIYVAVSGTKAAELAGRIGDGLVSTAPDAEVVQAWRRAGGSSPAYAHAHFEQAAQMVTPEDLAASLPHGPDPQAYLQSIHEYVDAGSTHVYFHQVGDDQEGWFRFWEQELAPDVPS